MKKYLTFIFLGISFIAISQDLPEQEDIDLDKKSHEIRIDAIEGLIVPAIDLSYEYLISKYSGAGISVFFNLSSEVESYQNFAITPYYRQYFFNKKDFGARGFFGEGILQYASGKDFDYINFQDDTFEEVEETWTAFGIGFAIGQKWVSNNGFVLEISVGGGRNLGNTDIAPEGFFRGGIAVGYRF